MSDLLVSIIRTTVPALVGTALSALATIGVTGVDSDAAVAVVTTITIGLYYAAVRLLEERYSQAGWLLGYRQAPTYRADV